MQRVLDPYLQHLAATHKARGVYATEDIWTDDGTIVLKAGQTLPPHIDPLWHHQALRKPLQFSVQVDRPLSVANIRDGITGTIPREQMETLYGKYELAEQLERGATVFSRFPLLVQHLTLLSLQLPAFYRQTLVVAWLCLIIGTKMKLRRVERTDLVVGALSHLLGMLYVQPAISARTDSLNSEERIAIQRYVELGVEMLRAVANLPAGIVRMVAEHRELPDGTGYPGHLEKEDLELPGQIIGLAQSAYSIYAKLLRPIGRSPRDLIPIIQINSVVYRQDVCFALLQLLREENLPKTTLVNDATIEQVVGGLLADGKAIEFCTQTMKGIIRDMLAAHPRPAVFRAEKIYRHLESILSSSGVIYSEQAAWMKQVAATKYAGFYGDIQDMQLMLGEVRWQLLRLGQLLQQLALDPDMVTPEKKDILQKLIEDMRIRST